MKRRQLTKRQETGRAIRLKLPGSLYAQALAAAKTRGITIDELVLDAVRVDLRSASAPSKLNPSPPLPVPEPAELVVEGLQTEDQPDAAALETRPVKEFSNRAPPGNRPSRQRGGG